MNKLDKLTIEKFFEEIDLVCKKYNVSIAHEDNHGGFIIEDYDLFNIEWLKDARIDAGRGKGRKEDGI